MQSPGLCLSQEIGGEPAGGRRGTDLLPLCPDPEVFALGKDSGKSPQDQWMGRHPEKHKKDYKGIQKGLVMELGQDEAALGRFYTWLRQKASQGLCW